jgi:hypothetical protein
VEAEVRDAEMRDEARLVEEPERGRRRGEQHR